MATITSPPARRLAVALLALVLVLLVPRAAAAGVSFNGDWQTGDNSQWSGLECPYPARQFAVVAAPPGRGVHAARFSVSPSDVWEGNDMIRCLDARYDTHETAGDDFYFGLSLFVPSTGIRNNLIWELHHPSSLYSIPGCGLAPYALLNHNGRLALRYVGGDCVSGRNWPIWETAIPIAGLDPTPVSTWIDIVIHIRFAESPTGRIELWARTGSNAWPAAPQIRRDNVVTLPYSTQANVHNVKLYTALGLYKGGSGITGTETIYLSGYRRGSSFADVAPGPAGASSGGTATTTTATTTTTTTTAATTTTATTTASSATGVNLAPNPGFETVNAGWYAHGKGSFSWVSDTRASGAYAVRLASSQALGALARWMSNPSTIPVQAGATYDIGASLRTASVAQSAQLVVTFWNASGAYISSAVAPALSGTQAWTRRSGSAVAPSGAAFARAEIRLTGPGTLWADDVVVARR